MTKYEELKLAGVLAAVFVLLKLSGNIAWSWWWVLSPLWVGLVLLACAFLCVSVAARLWRSS